MATKEKLKTKAARVREEARETGKVILRAPALVRAAECVIRFLLGAERAELIRALLNGLPPQDRAIFLRHYYYGQTAADIGAALAMPPSTVKVRLHRGRRKLKELLMERGYSCACADD